MTKEITAGARRPGARHFVLLAVGASLLLGLSCLPFVKSMMLEDWMHHATLNGALGPAQGVAARAPWEFFIFMEDGASLNEKARAFWFAHPSLKVAFWRPFSSLLIALDHRVFGPSPVAFFLHSLVWYVALCAIVAVIFSRLLPGTRGKVATILFAVLGTHHETVVWSAARNSLVCAVFGGLALWAHLRFREDDWKAGRWLTPLLLTVGYAGGEAALSMLGFLMAYEIAGAGPRSDRFKALLPTLGVTGMWLVLYVAQGYGASFSGEYINPTTQPLRYLAPNTVRQGFT
jgi:hypothetical protein